MRLVRVLSAACLLFALYVGLAGSVSVNEAVAGFGTICIVLVLVDTLHRGERRRLVLRPSPRVLWRMASSFVVDTARVAGTLLRVIVRRPVGRVGALVHVPFHHGDDDPSEAGRRAIVTLSASAAPNGIVLAVPRGGEAILLHRLVPAPIPADRIWPV